MKTWLLHKIFGCKWVRIDAPKEGRSMIRATRSCPICQDMEYGLPIKGKMRWFRVTPADVQMVYKAMNPYTAP